MKIVIGLGNPDKKYAYTRHNAGMMVVERLAEQLGNGHWQSRAAWSAEIQEVDDWLLVKPLTYMNESGKAVRVVLKKFGQLDASEHRNLWIIHDDLDLELGRWKIQYAVGPKIHQGLLSVYQAIGGQQFWHGRMGIDGRQGNRSQPSI